MYEIRHHQEKLEAAERLADALYAQEHPATDREATSLTEAVLDLTAAVREGVDVLRELHELLARRVL